MVRIEAARKFAASLLIESHLDSLKTTKPYLTEREFVTAFNRFNQDEVMLYLNKTKASRITHTGVVGLSPYAMHQTPETVWGSLGRSISPRRRHKEARPEEVDSDADVPETEVAKSSKERKSVSERGEHADADKSDTASQAGSERAVGGHSSANKDSKQRRPSYGDTLKAMVRRDSKPADEAATAAAAEAKLAEENATGGSSEPWYKKLRRDSKGDKSKSGGKEASISASASASSSKPFLSGVRDKFRQNRSNSKSNTADPS